MKNIYSESLQAITEGARFQISFEKRSFKLNKQVIIGEGQFTGELGIEIPDSIEGVLKKLEGLYLAYRYSVPSERSCSIHKTYFRALPEHMLDDDDLICGEPRETARFALEYYMLCVLMSGRLQWENFSKGNWFWKSPSVPSLVIFKHWLNN